YPNQPAYARPVELIIPSIGFGLLYLYFGLLPGIILHFTFDVVWFALPIFMMKAPGIWFQQAMIVVFTLVPVWVVLRRRLQAGRWTELAPADYNAAWQPPPAPVRVVDLETAPVPLLGLAARRAWLGLGAASLAVLIALATVKGGGNPHGGLPFTRTWAEATARDALERRGVTLTP